MRHGRDRCSFLCSRIWLRVILGRYLGLDADAVRFSVGDRGKPEVLDGGDLRFSLSRSGGAGLIAVTRGRAVGVDIEWTRPGLDEVGLAGRFFSPAEADLVRRLPEPARGHAFYRLWVRKEAVVKASGAGLGDGLGHVDVRTDTVAGGWSVASLDLGADVVGAVAVEGAMGPISTWTVGDGAPP